MNRPIQIFLVEDNPGDVGLVREALREHGVVHNLLVASDGPAARSYIERMGSANAPVPDILLLDLNLPTGDGYEIFSWFRAHPLGSHIPVIFVTSSNAPKDRERAASLGAARYFRKPSDLQDFLELGAMIREVSP
jgi:CheY-like chemotaxis protein